MIEYEASFTRYFHVNKDIDFHIWLQNKMKLVNIIKYDTACFALGSALHTKEIIHLHNNVTFRSSLLSGCNIVRHTRGIICSTVKHKTHWKAERDEEEM